MYYPSGVFYLHEVIHHPKHTLYLRIVFMLHDLVHFAEAEGDQRQFLTLGLIDRTSDQFDFYLAHLLSSYEL